MPPGCITFAFDAEKTIMLLTKLIRNKLYYTLIKVRFQKNQRGIVLFGRQVLQRLLLFLPSALLILSVAMLPCFLALSLYLILTGETFALALVRPHE
jgi:hypothetical protein